MGGHIEHGEFPYQAMRREWNEEAGAAEHNWREYLHLDWAQGTVHFFTAYTAYKTDYFGGPSDEPVHWYKVEDVLAGKLNTIPNLRWLIPMAMDHENCTALVLEPSEGLAWQTRPTPQPSSEYVKAVEALEQISNFKLAHAGEQEEREAVIDDSKTCSECDYMKAIRHPISNLCSVHFMRLENIKGRHGEAEASQHYHMRAIAREVLATLKSHPTPAKEPSGESEKAAELAEMGYELSAYAASIHWSAKETNEAEWLVGLKKRIVILQGVYKHYRAQVTK